MKNHKLCDKVCQWFAEGRCFPLDTSVSSTKKTDPHNITEILLKVALNTTNHKPNLICFCHLTKSYSLGILTTRVFCPLFVLIQIWNSAILSMLMVLKCVPLPLTTHSWQLDFNFTRTRRESSLGPSHSLAWYCTSLSVKEKNDKCKGYLYLPAIVWFWVLIKGVI